MGSKRLPGKSMMNLLENYKLIDYTIQSALNSNFLSNKNIYLLTSKNLNNLKLIKILRIPP
jgi:spore coat polysaccharide biosynthesis protein SpsF (cytidylyltransferase family)